jgi:hypothetical protein
MPNSDASSIHFRQLVGGVLTEAVGLNFVPQSGDRRLSLRNFKSLRQSLAGIASLFFLAGVLSAEILPVDLVGADAGLVIEVHDPLRTWNEFQQDELFRRWSATSLARDVANSEPMKRWREIDVQVTEATGVSLTDQLTELCARELVLALFLPPTGEPQGVLITRASSPAAIERFVATGAALDPDITIQTHEHRGEKYFSRLTAGPKQTRLFYVSFGDVFALSDHEPRIQQVIELKQSPAKATNPSPRMTSVEAYRMAANSESQSPAALRAVLVAAPWQRVWQESAENDAGAAWMAKTWPAIHAISVDVRTEVGLHVVSQVHVDPDRTGKDWQAWTASTPSPQQFLVAVPPAAVLAAAGGVHFQPLMKTVSEIASESDREGFKRGRRLLRGFLGGKDLFTDILPALTHDFGMYLVPAEHVQRQTFSSMAVLQFRFPPQPEAKEMFLALDQALSSGLALISAQANEADGDGEPTTVHSDVAEGKILRWLQSPQPIGVAYQLTPEGLLISRTPELLRSHQTERPADAASSVFLAARDKWFPDAGQILVVDVERLRHLHDSQLTQQGELLSLCDLAYFAMQMDVKRLTVRVGLALK